MSYDSTQRGVRRLSPGENRQEGSLARYQVWIAKPACREIKKLTKPAQAQVTATIEKLSENPLLPATEKLQGRPAFFRVRSGNFRIIYNVRSEQCTVIILVVRDRKDALGDSKSWTQSLPPPSQRWPKRF